MTDTSTSTTPEPGATPDPGGSDSDTARTQSAPQPEPQDERTRVLRMVADGRITVDEAVALLQALQPQAAAAGATHENAPNERHQPWGPWGQWGWRFGPFSGTHAPFGPGGPGRHDVRWEQRVGPVDVRAFKRGAPGRGGRAGRHPEGDVFFTAAVPPMPPVPPVPPMPGMHPIPPVPPMPPGGPFTVGLANRVLVFEIDYEGNHYNARLPLGLVGDVNRFLPRQARHALGELEIEVDKLVDLVNNMAPDHDGTLIEIDHEGNQVKVRVE